MIRIHQDPNRLRMLAESLPNFHSRLEIKDVLDNVANMMEGGGSHFVCMCPDCTSLKTPVAELIVRQAVMADALDHIIRTVNRARVSSKRLTWIASRAQSALDNNDNWRTAPVPTNGVSELAKAKRKLAAINAMFPALRELVEAVETEFCSPETEAIEPDDSKISFPEEDCHITFGMIRRARQALEAEKFALPPEEPTASPRRTAMEDAINFGTGFEVDGVRIDPARVKVQAMPRVFSDAQIDHAIMIHEGVRSIPKGGWGDKSRERMRASLESISPVKQEPRAWLHTMHCESNQKNYKFTVKPDNAPFGKRGVSYDPSYEVTSEPLFTSPQPAQPSVPVEALQKVIADFRVPAPVVVGAPYEREIHNETMQLAARQLEKLIAAHDGQGNGNG